jgi:hypothetical protein
MKPDAQLMPAAFVSKNFGSAQFVSSSYKIELILPLPSLTHASDPDGLDISPHRILEQVV